MSSNPWYSRLRTALAAGRVCLLIAAAWPAVSNAQVPANEHWYTLRTRHFNVYFTRPLEGEARHAAAVAEQAYANLATELVPPRGRVEVIVTDAADVSNGSATVFPRNRIVIYARPPVDEPSLESYDDWTVLVLQHEMTHIFHLDRSRGIWSAAQHLFGRNPVLFPNYYTPAWLTEGLAVYYESRFTSGGRLLGSYHTAVARAAAVDHLVPTLDRLSLATSRFPFGQSVYVYGSFVWDDIARRHGPESIPAFVERSSGAVIPLLLDREAKRAFGETFTHAWKDWRDSVLRHVSDTSGPMRLRTTLTGAPPLAPDHVTVYEVPRGGRYLLYPRWRDDTTLVYVGNNGRETSGLYSVSVPLRSGGRARRGDFPRHAARRNTLDVNSPLADGTVVFAQGEYLDRFHTRGDLYLGRGDNSVRLTTGARLSAPDVRRDGEIVAVQTVPAATRLVLVSANGRQIRPLTRASSDTQWIAPRWSPDGTRVAAVRAFDGVSQLVLLDATDAAGGAGAAPQVIRSERAVIRSPVWSPDGASLVFTSDVSGSSQLYALLLGTDTAAGGVTGEARQLTQDRGGVYGVDLVPDHLNPDTIRLAATVLRGNGYHVAVWDLAAATLGDVDPATVARPESPVASTPGSDTGTERHGNASSPRPLGQRDPRWDVADDTSAATEYSPWHTLAPTYWSPILSAESEGRGSLLGALTSGSDVIGRHSYYVQGDVNTSNGNIDALAQYSYRGFLNPILSASVEQTWSYSNLLRGTARVGDLERESRLAGVSATVVRPRARSYAALTLRGEFEQRQYATTPGNLLARLPAFYAAAHRYPAVVASGLFSNVQRPTLSISPEDGVTLAASVRQRWETVTGAAGAAAASVATGYKSLDLPGFAHHVLALRVALGIADRRSPGEYSVGGVSGSGFEIAPGVGLGGGSRLFPLRGFAAGSETGIRAVSATTEYRLPLAIPSRGLGLFPLFLDRASMTFFADAGRASCPSGSTPACASSGPDGGTLASLGAELDLDSAVQFDIPYRFRLGLAHPIRGAAYAGAAALSVFVTVGGSF